MQEIQIVLIGATGRMGRSLLPILEAERPFSVACGLEKEGGGFLEKGNTSIPLLASLGSFKADSAWEHGLRAAVDFSNPRATLYHLRQSAEEVPIWIIGSTGFSQAEEEEIKAFSRSNIIVKAGNFSVGIHVLLGLMRLAIEGLGLEDYDLEIIEAHHKHKMDSPSGTAKMLLEAACRARASGKDNKQANIDNAENAVYGRMGAEKKRRKGEIGMHSLRGGALVGEHGLRFLGDDDEIILEHRAFSRKAFSSGVVKAIYFGAAMHAERRLGLYDMNDVLGFPFKG